MTLPFSLIISTITTMLHSMPSATWWRPTTIGETPQGLLLTRDRIQTPISTVREMKSLSAVQTGSNMNHGGFRDQVFFWAMSAKRVPLQRLTAHLFYSMSLTALSLARASKRLQMLQVMETSQRLMPRMFYSLLWAPSADSRAQVKFLHMRLKTSLHWKPV